jgi:hypothetical protein
VPAKRSNRRWRRVPARTTPWPIWPRRGEGRSPRGARRRFGAGGGEHPLGRCRNNAFTFNQGSEVYLLDAPAGEVFIMQSFTAHWDESLTKDNLAQLGSKLTMPDGWEFPGRGPRP